MILYSIDKKGKIRVFQIEQKGVDSYTTSTGILGGKLTSKSCKVSEGKQKRTIEEQVNFQINSEIESKLDEGYKSIDMLKYKHIDIFPLGTEGSLTAGIDEISTEERVKFLFNALNIKYNTNRNWLPLPMLAEKWKDYKHKVIYPTIGQPKLNGVRCQSIFSADAGKVLLCSRGGQLYNMPHIEKALLPIFEQQPEAILDGELYCHNLPLQIISGIVRNENPDYTRKLEIEYHLYDSCDSALKQTLRLNNKNYAVELVNSSYIKAVKETILGNEADVKDYHDKCIQEGYEGAIIRDSAAVYQFGFRDICLLKVKEFIDEEFEILGCEIDLNKGIESFVFILRNNFQSEVLQNFKKQEFKARPTGTLEQKEIWRQNIDKYVGKLATVRYQERTVDGLPHQAHVRADKTSLLIEHIRPKGE